MGNEGKKYNLYIVVIVVTLSHMYESLYVT